MNLIDSIWKIMRYELRYQNRHYSIRKNEDFYNQSYVILK